MHLVEALFELFQLGDFGVDAAAAQIFQPGVVLVIARQRALRRLIGKVHLVEVLVGGVHEDLLPIDRRQLFLFGMGGGQRRHKDSKDQCSGKFLHVPSRVVLALIRLPGTAQGWQAIHEFRAEPHRDGLCRADI